LLHHYANDTSDVSSTQTLKYKYKYLSLKYEYKYKYPGHKYKYSTLKYKYKYLICTASTCQVRKCRLTQTPVLYEELSMST